MGYQLLTDDEQDEILAQTLHAQERDHFCHSLNVERYKQILPNLSPDDPYRSHLETLIGTEQIALDRVTVFVKQTAKQAPSVARLAAAHARVLARADGPVVK